MASSLRIKILEQASRAKKIRDELKDVPKKKEEPVSEEEHKKRMEMLKNLGLLKD